MVLEWLCPHCEPSSGPFQWSPATLITLLEWFFIPISFCLHIYNIIKRRCRVFCPWWTSGVSLGSHRVHLHWGGPLCCDQGWGCSRLPGYGRLEAFSLSPEIQLCSWQRGLSREESVHRSLGPCSSQLTWGWRWRAFLAGRPLHVGLWTTHHSAMVAGRACSE